MTEIQNIPVLNDPGRASPLTDLRSVQKPTVCYDDVCFGDVLEALNPLNHIPVVSNYMEDGAAPDNPVMPLAKMLGGGLIGGVFGLIGAAINVVFEEATGGSVAENVAAAVTQTPQQTAYATGETARGTRLSLRT